MNNSTYLADAVYEKLQQKLQLLYCGRPRQRGWLKAMVMWVRKSSAACQRQDFHHLNCYPQKKKKKRRMFSLSFISLM